MSSREPWIDDSAPVCTKASAELARGKQRIGRRLALPLEAAGEVSELRVRDHLLDVRSDLGVGCQQGSQANVLDERIKNPELLPRVLDVQADLLAEDLVDPLVDISWCSAW